MITISVVKPSCYQDSVVLLALARELRALPGVADAAALMGTPANRDLLARSGLLGTKATTAGPNDLIVAIRADPGDAEAACRHAEALLAARRRGIDGGGQHQPRTLHSGRRRLAGASLALISVPGAWAAAEARRALGLGLHVMLFSDNVSIEDEIALKQLAVARGLLLMGPDCGTAYLGGTALGFANAVPRGRVGIVAASGTGLQQVATLLAAGGEGVSQAIGVGGRDMSEAVGGVMTLAALDALAGDPATEVIVVIGKPPAPNVRGVVESRLQGQPKPAVVALMGADAMPGHRRRVAAVTTLEDAAAATLAELTGQPWSPRPFSLSPIVVRDRVGKARCGLGPGTPEIRGLYAGGTLAHEAVSILETLMGPIEANVHARDGGSHRVIDLGADEHTAGRPHPMLDAGERVKAIAAAAEDGVGVLLLDVVLGHGAAVDPAGDIAPALQGARDRARARGRDLAIVASVIGVEADPQGRRSQVARLEAAGTWVLPSNAQAARAAACIAGGDTVLDRLLKQ